MAGGGEGYECGFADDAGTGGDGAGSEEAVFESAVGGGVGEC